MRTRIFALACLLLSIPALAQTETESDNNRKKEVKPFRRSFAVKFNPGSLAFGKASFGTEWNYRPKRSVTFYLGVPMNTKVPDGILKQMLGDEQKNPTIEYKSFSIAAGYRMYMGKRPMTGFYFEPYIKHMSFEMNGTYTDKIDFGGTVGEKDATLRITNKYSGIGVGAQLGLQFMIAKTVVFDMFILGPEANISNLSSTFKDVTGSPTDTYWADADLAAIEREIRDAVKGIPMVGEKINVKADRAGKSISADYNGFLPGLRAGISVGIRF
jgi:hypothetical protein